jgi:hypothetical protein
MLHAQALWVTVSFGIEDFTEDHMALEVLTVGT